jgi:hypothetical protein
MELGEVGVSVEGRLEDVAAEGAEWFPFNGEGGCLDLEGLH